MAVRFDPLCLERAKIVSAEARSKHFDPDYVSIKEFAALLSLSERQVKRMNAAGIGPPRHWYKHRHGYLRTEVMAWLETHKKPRRR